MISNIHPLNTFDLKNPIEDNNFHHKRHSTNIKSKNGSNEIKLQPGEIYYSENGSVEEPHIMKNYQNNVYLTSSKEISKRDDTLNRKIFSIINSSGTEEDENSGINIVVQNPNIIMEMENNDYIRSTHKLSTDRPVFIKRLAIDGICHNQFPVNSEEDILRSLDDKETFHKRPLTDRGTSGRTRKEEINNQKNVVSLLSSSLIREINYKNYNTNNSMRDFKLTKGKLYSEENFSDNY